MDYNEFAQKVKTKYPEYNDMDNLELAQKIVAKYPEYAETVTFEQIPTEQNKGVDITPRAIGERLGNALSSAIVSKRDNIPYEEAYKQGEEKLKAFNQEPLNQAGNAIGDMALYSELPILKGGGALNFAGNALIQGGVPGAIEGLKEGEPLSGAGTGTAIAGTLQSLPIIGKPIGNAIQKRIEDPVFQKKVGKIIEALTSVPEKYTNRALEKELTGNSLFKGKFDAETAYRPIEAKLREAKGMLPTSESYAREFQKLGDKSVNSLNNLKAKLGNSLGEVLSKMNGQEQDFKGLQLAVDSVIRRFGEGGSYNSALELAPRTVEFINNALSKEKLTLRDIDRLKNDLYNIGYTGGADKTGAAAEVARGVAEQLNAYLRGNVKGYSMPNDQLSLIHNVTDEVTGNITPQSFGKKISNLGSDNNIITGQEQALKDLDNLLPQNERFYNKAKDLVKSQNEVNNIKKRIGEKYERNPKLLSNINNIEDEQALEQLQNMTGTNFMGELEDIRAREALEKWFPGQGGGSGSSEGFGNLLRTGIIGGAPTAAAITRNPSALAGLGLVSPKFMGQGTIKNLGALYRNAGREIPESVKRLLTPLAIKSSVPMLYGGISND